MVLYVLVCQGMPFSIDMTATSDVDGTTPISEEHATQAMQQNIQMGRFSMEPCDRLGLSAEVRDLIESLLCVDPALRPNVSEALAHPWFAKFDLLGNEESQNPAF